MNKKNLAAIVALAFALLVGCDATLEVKGTVSDVDGTPLTNATVLLQTDSEQEVFAVETDERGEFHAWTTGATGTYRIVICKDGYVPDTRQFDNKSERVIVEAKLKEMEK